MGQFVRANSRPGRRGLFEGGEMTNEDWAAAEAYGASLPDPSWSPGGGAGSTTEWGPNMGGGTYPQPARRTVFPNAGNGNNQTINPFGGIGRVIGRGIRAVGNKLQGLRGWNPDGTPKTQAQWEEEREQRIAQKRINNILGRDAPATKATNINLDRLYNTLGTPKTGRNLFTEDEINERVSPAMRQIYQTPDYKLMDGQGLEGTTEFNRLFKNEDEIRQMIENSNKTTSLPTSTWSERVGNQLGIKLQPAAALNTDKILETEWAKRSIPWDKLKPGHVIGSQKAFDKLRSNTDIQTWGDLYNYGLSGGLGVSGAQMMTRNPQALEALGKEMPYGRELGINNWPTDFELEDLYESTDTGGYGLNVPLVSEGDAANKNWSYGVTGREKGDELDPDVEAKLRARGWLWQGGRVGYNTGGRVGILSVF
jgi:hypothetical protein